MKQKKINNIKQLPQFTNEDEERTFWANHDFIDYMHLYTRIDMDTKKLKYSTKPITLRMSEDVLSDLRTLANKNDVPYQSLMKIYLAERVQVEMKKLLSKSL